MRILLLSLILLSIQLPSLAQAAIIRLVPSVGSTFTLMGEGFKDVAGLTFILKYNSSVVGPPKVIPGDLFSGALFVANPNVPGQITIALVSQSGISGTGAIATISFVSSSSSTSAFSGSIVNMVNSKIEAIPVIFDNQAPQDSSVATSGQQSTQTEFQQTATPPVATEGMVANPSSSAGVAVVGGTLTLGGDKVPEKEPVKPVAQDQANPTTYPQGDNRQNEVTPTPLPPAKPKEPLVLPPPPKSVVERFRSVRGERTVAALRALFSDRGGSWITQEPAIAVADGKTAVSIVVAFGQQNVAAPSFAFSNLKSGTVKATDDNEWIIECVPANNALQASTTMLVEGVSVEIPVTVVPPLSSVWSDSKLSDVDIDKFLAERGTEKAPAGDLNNDGKRDYLDDYIMVGNFLLRAKSASEKKNGVGAGEIKPAPRINSVTP